MTFLVATIHPSVCLADAEAEVILVMSARSWKKQTKDAIWPVTSREPDVRPGCWGPKLQRTVHGPLIVGCDVQH